MTEWTVEHINRRDRQIADLTHEIKQLREDRQRLIRGAMSDLGQIYGLLEDGLFEEAQEYCRGAAETYTQDIAMKSELICAFEEAQKERDGCRAALAAKDAEIERLRGLLRDYSQLVSRLTYPEGEKQFVAEWQERVRGALGDK